MLRNCLAAALRHLARSRLYAAISVLGLAVGMAAALLASLVPRNQLTQDHFIPGYERIYMGVTAVTPPGHATIYQPSTSNFVGRQLALRFSEIEAVTRLFPMRVTLRHEGIETQEGIYYADPNALDVLALPVIAGDPQATLKRPDGVLITVSTARRYFGRDLPLGETLLLQGMPDGPHALTVGAVLKDLPLHGTHLRSGVFVSSQGEWTELHRQDAIPGNVPGSDVGFGILTYVKLAPHASPQRLLAAMPHMANELFKRPPEGWSVALQLVRMDRINAFAGLNPGFSGRLLTMILVGAGVLLIALINFVNLQTALTARRAREVAIRKLAGAGRRVLLAQFLIESVIYVLIAVLLSVALTEWLLPWVNAFLDAGATFDYWRDPLLLGALLAAAAVLGVLVGAWPAWLLSGSQPAAVLKGCPAQRSGRAGRQLLVALQFAVMIGLMIASGVIYLQRQFATREALRVDTEQMLLVRSACRPAFIEQLRSLPGVRGAACSENTFLGDPAFVTTKDRRGVLQLMYYVTVAPPLLALYGIRPVAGALSAGSVSTAYVVNETGARRLGFARPADAVGATMPDVRGTGDKDKRATLPVIGVVPDFSLESVTRKIEALGYYVTPADPDFNLVSIRLTGRQIPEALAAIDELWRRTGDGKPINRQFLDQRIQELYISLLREAQLLTVFVAVAVALACLGLLGLAASITQRRSREIGIRKALGADTGHVLSLLLRELSRPVVWANLIAWPAAAWAMERWLDSFAYHVDLPLWLFPAAAAVTVQIALLTVGTHAARAARSRPVAVLRYE
jgi:putative ABC transport system permease protein